MKKTKKWISVLLICAVALMLMAGCGGNQDAQTNDEQQPVEPKGEVILATTTSTQDSGLLDYLLPEFEKETGWKVNTIAVGTGKALQMGVDGEADVLFNSALAYELAILKKHAQPLLQAIERSEPEYSDAQRLLSFLNFFEVIEDESIIPNNSILREFIGGSIFSEYL